MGSPGSDLGRVLVIEDDPDVRLVLEFGLQQAGAREVVLADDGPTGLALARTMQPDLVLCDLMLPGLDGLAVVQALRSGEPPCTMPVIFVTAYGTAAFRDRTPREMGAAGVLLKPFRVNKLGEEIRRILADS